MNIYRVTNVVTGEEIEGTARNIFKKTGIFTAYIYKYSKITLLYKGTWRIEKLEETTWRLDSRM